MDEKIVYILGENSVPYPWISIAHFAYTDNETIYERHIHKCSFKIFGGIVVTMECVYILIYYYNHTYMNTLQKN